MRRLGVLLALLALPWAPANGQAAGRWTVVLRGPSHDEIRGELRLEEAPGGELRGRLRLADDPAGVELTRARIDPRGAIEFHARIGPEARFAGTLAGDEIHGRVYVGGELRHEWHAARLREGQEYYAELPRFSLRQLLVGHGGTELRLPGRWLGAARAAGLTPDSVVAEYRGAARRAGVAPLAPDSLVHVGLLRAMGLYRRAELRDAGRRTLEAIRTGLRDDALRLRFDLLFRPGGEWLVDLHDAALHRARRKGPPLEWRDAFPALMAARLVPPELPAEAEPVPLALYRLFVTGRDDSVAYGNALTEMRRREPASATAVERLLDGYAQALGWYEQVMRFLLLEPWLGRSDGPRTVAGLVTARWPALRDRSPPEIRIHPFGYPEGAQRVGVTGDLLEVLVRPDNAAARAWLERHGAAGMATVLRRLPSPGDSAVVVTADGTYRISSVDRHARESFGGFLDPEDAILLDPSYFPLFAVGTMVHEWEHILHERARRAVPPPGGPVRVRGEEATLVGPNVYLAEGLAEWEARRALAPVVGRFPLVAVGEAEKLAMMARSRPTDPHLLGYLMVRVLVATLADERRVVPLLTRLAADPAAVVGEAPLASAWARFAGTPDLTVPIRGGRVLIPAVRFTVEDMVPDVIQVRIVTGAAAPGAE